MQHAYWSSSSSLPNIIKLSQTVWELWPAQDFGFRGDNYITKIVRVTPLHATCLLVLLCIPTKYYRYMYKGINVMERSRMLYERPDTMLIATVYIPRTYRSGDNKNWRNYADNKIANRHFQESRDRTYNSKRNNLIWTVFTFFQDFIHVYLICKFQDHPIKTEQVMLMIKSNISFSNNQRNITLW